MSDKLQIDNLIKQFFNAFGNSNQLKPDWDLISHLCLAESIIIKKTGLTEEIYTLQTFIEPRKKLLSDGTLTEFEESETEEETKINGNIAQRYSKYQKKGYLNGTYFQGFGTKFFQFIKTKIGWKINAVIWEDD